MNSRSISQDSLSKYAIMLKDEAFVQKLSDLKKGLANTITLAIDQEFKSESEDLRLIIFSDFIYNMKDVVNKMIVQNVAPAKEEKGEGNE